MMRSMLKISCLNIINYLQIKIIPFIIVHSSYAIKKVRIKPLPDTVQWSNILKITQSNINMKSIGDKMNWLCDCSNCRLSAMYATMFTFDHG